MVTYCILTGLLVYYIALWLWYRHADNRRSEKGTNDKTVPESQADGYTLIGESRYKGGLIGTTAGWQRWRNCWDATKRNWLRLLPPELAIPAGNTKRST